jgi:hypothetical protein
MLPLLKPARNQIGDTDRAGQNGQTDNHGGPVRIGTATNSSIHY